MPKFGNWETEEDIPYTAYFENPRRVSSSEKVNPNKSPDNPNLVSRFEARRGSEKQEHMVKQEDGEHNVRSYDSPSRPNGGRRASVNSPKRVARINGGGFRSADNSPMHPHYQAKKGSTVSSPSRERKGPSDGNGNLGLAPSTPGRSRLRTVVRGNETVRSFSFFLWSSIMYKINNHPLPDYAKIDPTMLGYSNPSFLSHELELSIE